MGVGLAKAIMAALLLVPTAAAPVAAAAQGGKAPAVTTELLLGRWSDSGDCQRDWVDFRSDGVFVTHQGGSGRWRLEGGRLVFTGQTEVRPRIEATDRDHIVLTHADGSVGRSVRCAAAQRLAMPAMPATVDEAVRISRPVSDSALLLGTWTDTGDCAATGTITFHADGRFTIPTGGGRWQLVGERLSFIANSTATARVRSIGSDRIVLIHDNGEIGQSLRC